MRARVFAIANQKGGVGKTTTAINLAACLAEAGERSLVIDLDPQGNATSGLGERANGTSSIDLLDGAPLRELAKPTRFANLDLIPAKPDLAGTAAELSRRGDGERYLADALAAANGDYSFVFVDCPPSLGPLTVNALAAADRVLVPLQAEYYALEGLAQLVRSVELIRARLNPGLHRERPALRASCRGAQPRLARDGLRPTLGRCRRVLEGGDGACRAQLTLPAAASAAASKS
jgi:chromosome partitioning protein